MNQSGLHVSSTCPLSKIEKKNIYIRKLNYKPYENLDHHDFKDTLGTTHLT